MSQPAAADGHFIQQTCPLCGCGDHQPVWMLDTFAVVRCTGCSHQYVLNPWTYAHLEEHCFGLSPHLSEPHRRQQKKTSRLAEKRVLQVLRRHAGVRHVLEIGCGYGYLLDLLRRSGFDVCGWEIDSTSRRHAVDEFGLTVFSGELASCPKPATEGSGYDVVICFNVIEHVVEPLQMLRDARRLLRPGGLLAVETDNFGSRMSLLFGESFWMNAPYLHIQHWKPETLSLALEKSGCEVIHKSYWAPAQVIGWYARFKFRRLLGKAGAWQEPFVEPRERSAPPASKSDVGSVRALKRFLAAGLFAPLAWGRWWRSPATGVKMLYVARAED